MSSDSYEIQHSWTLDGRGLGLMCNVPSGGENPDTHRERVLEEGLGCVPMYRAVEAEWKASVPGQTAPLSPPAATQTPSYDQGVANVQAGLNAQPVTTAPGRPQNGEVFPGKFCSCGAPRVVAAGISKAKNKPYYRLDCSVSSKDHDCDWSMNPK